MRKNKNKNKKSITFVIREAISFVRCSVLHNPYQRHVETQDMAFGGIHLTLIAMLTSLAGHKSAKVN